MTSNRLITAALLLQSSLLFTACSREALSAGEGDDPGVGVISSDVTIAPEATGVSLTAITEAPAGFDNLTNGVLSQVDFDAARAVFEGFDGGVLGHGVGAEDGVLVDFHHGIGEGRGGAGVADAESGHGEGF